MRDTIKHNTKKIQHRGHKVRHTTKKHHYSPPKWLLDKNHHSKERQSIAHCWEKINRKHFVTSHFNWKRNKPIKIGNNQTTSQPTLISNMIYTLFIRRKYVPKASVKVLDIGYGSGVVAALFNCLYPNSLVIGIDIYKDFEKKAYDNMKHLPHKNVHFLTLDAYKLFANHKLLNNLMKRKIGKFDYIYVGAEPKSPADIRKFKLGVPKLLNKGGVAVAPIEGVLQVYWKNTWKKLDSNIRFVPLQSGGSSALTETEQKKLIKEEHNSRISLDCEKTDTKCDIIAITARSANLYKNHLFPDFKSLQSLIKWSRDKCIIDVGSGINTLYKGSLVAKLEQKYKDRKTGDALGVDINDINKTRKHKPYARFVKGNAKTLKLRDLKLNECKKRVILINNMLYLWIDSPSEIKKFYENLFKWLTPGSEIRVFPVYFGRYDMYNENLKKYIDKHCYVELLDPKITSESMYELDVHKHKKVYLNKPLLKDEKEINKSLGAKTLVLTMK